MVCGSQIRLLMTRSGHASLAALNMVCLLSLHIRGLRMPVAKLIRTVAKRIKTCVDSLQYLDRIYETYLDTELRGFGVPFDGLHGNPKPDDPIKLPYHTGDCSTVRTGRSRDHVLWPAGFTEHQGKFHAGS